MMLMEDGVGGVGWWWVVVDGVGGPMATPAILISFTVELLRARACPNDVLLLSDLYFQGSFQHARQVRRQLCVCGNG